MLIELAKTSDEVRLLEIVAGAGAVGGLVGELLIARGKQAWTTGEIEIPGKQDRFFDLGSLAALLIGLVAGLVALLFFSPVREVVVSGVTRQRYDLPHAIGLGLAAGLAGPGFLSVVQQRFKALLDAKRAQGAVAGMTKGINLTPDHMAQAVQDAIKAQLGNLKPTLEEALQKSESRMPAPVHDELMKRKIVDSANPQMLPAVAGGKPTPFEGPSSQEEISAQADRLVEDLATKLAGPVSAKVQDRLRQQLETVRQVAEATAQGTSEPQDGGQGG